MRAASLRFPLLIAVLLSQVACASKDANVAQHGGLWEQAFSQALSEKPGKAAE